jgi:hypothetical protein
MEELATFIAVRPLREMLFGFTSMHDLCIQQTMHQPTSVAYLRISPQGSGLIEFRYVDTRNKERQWHRIEPPERVVERLESFLRQLHWISLPAPDSAESQVDELKA